MNHFFLGAQKKFLPKKKFLEEITRKTTCGNPCQKYKQNTNKNTNKIQTKIQTNPKKGTFFVPKNMFFVEKTGPSGPFFSLCLGARLRRANFTIPLLGARLRRAISTFFPMGFRRITMNSFGFLRFPLRFSENYHEQF